MSFLPIASAPAIQPMPRDADVHRSLSAAMRNQGDELAALAHLVAAAALDDIARGAMAGNPVANICNVATGYFMKGDYELAARWYGLVLVLDGNVASAYQNLAAIHEQWGRAVEVASYRDRAYRLQRVFVEDPGVPARRVLILCVGRTSGNVPIESLLPTPACCRIKYVIDYAADAEDEQLPPYDLVFNAIGEPDVAALLIDRLAKFASNCQRPVLNSPLQVVRTRRHLLPGLLAGLENVVTASCMRFEEARMIWNDRPDRLDLHGVAFPLLARPAETHGGQGMVLCDHVEALENALQSFSGAGYLSDYRDYRSADGYFRKYRIIFIDRQPFPYHLAISTHWMVHYFSADMEANPWKIDEEKQFLENAAAVLGPSAMAAIRAIGLRMDLDYAGIDFALLPDGQVLVFEANATMLVHAERLNGPLAFKNYYVQRIVTALELLQIRRCAE